MALSLSKTGITTGESVEAWHVTQSIDAFNGTEEYDIILSGSLMYKDGNEGLNKVLVDIDNNGSLGFSSTLNLTSITASAFSGSYTGDGTNITGVTAEWDGSHLGDASITGSLTVTDTISGSFVGDGNLTGSFTGSFIGDGSGLTGVISEWDGTLNGNAEITGSIIVTSNTTLGGGVTFNTRNLSTGGDFSTLISDYIIFYTTPLAGGINLHTSANTGQCLSFIRISGSLSATLDGVGGDLINGVASITLPTALYSRVNVVYDGTSWYATEETPST